MCVTSSATIKGGSLNTGKKRSYKYRLPFVQLAAYACAVHNAQLSYFYLALLHWVVALKFSTIKMQGLREQPGAVRSKGGNMLTYKALSVSATLVLPLEANGYVLSVHNDHLNIALPEGIVTLQKCGTPHIPFGVEVATGESWRSWQLNDGCPVVYQNGRFVIDSKLAVEDLEVCARHSSRPCTNSRLASDEMQELLFLLDRLCRGSDKPGGILTYLDHYRFEGCGLTKCAADGALKRKIGRCFELLLTGIAKNDDFLIAEGVHGFLGLGPGLTPSGDDFLVGFLCGITFLPTERCRTTCAKLAQCLAQDAPLLTNALSAEYIKYAANGSYHAYFLRLLHALAQGSVQQTLKAGKSILSLGHYSGTDLLLGFVYGGMSAIHLSRGDSI